MNKLNICPLEKNANILSCFDATSLIDSLPCIYILKDIHSNYLCFNQEALRVSQISKREGVIGKTDIDMPWREFSDRYMDQDKRVMRGETLFNIDPTIRTDGSKILLLTKKAPIYSNSGKIIAVSGVSFELSRDKFSNLLTLLASSGLTFSDFSFDSQERSSQFRYEDIEFSPRQAQVVGRLLRGHSAESASKALNISRRTVETHIENIKNILNYDKKSDLINMAFEKGFIDLMFVQ